MYEFLYGFPPFHASTPNQVFEKILSRSIEWYEEDMDLTTESRDLMNRLICISVEKRLGNNQVKQHAFFSEIDWETLLEKDGSFIPKTDNVEDTNYFDNRGAKKPTNEVESDLKSTPSIKRTDGADFGEFAYKNLPLLEKANSDLMKKLKSERSWSDLSTGARSRKPSTSKWVHSRGVSTNERLISAVEDSPQLSQTSGDDSFESRFKHKILESPGQMSRNRFKKNIASGGSSSAPMSPITPSSFLNDTRWTPLLSGPRPRLDSISSTEPRSESPFLSDTRTFCILVADDNIVSCAMLESMILNKGNCECVCVHDGAEAIRISLGTTKFDLILMDLGMPIIDGETAAKMIRSTDNINKKTLIIAMATDNQQPALDIFDQVVKKPISKQDLERLIL
jgi:serine/threonine-protein kinase RIM15